MSGDHGQVSTQHVARFLKQNKSTGRQFNQPAGLNPYLLLSAAIVSGVSRRCYEVENTPLFLIEAVFLELDANDCQTRSLD